MEKSSAQEKVGTEAAKKGQRYVQKGLVCAWPMPLGQRLVPVQRAVWFYKASEVLNFP